MWDSPGESRASKASDASTTGMRSWMAAMSGAAALVRSAQVTMEWLAGASQTASSPAKAMTGEVGA